MKTFPKLSVFTFLLLATGSSIFCVPGPEGTNQEKVDNTVELLLDGERGHRLVDHYSDFLVKINMGPEHFVELELPLSLVAEKIVNRKVRQPVIDAWFLWAGFMVACAYACNNGWYSFFCGNDYALNKTEHLMVVKRVSQQLEKELRKVQPQGVYASANKRIKIGN